MADYRALHCDFLLSKTSHTAPHYCTFVSKGGGGIFWMDDNQNLCRQTCATLMVFFSYQHRKILWSNCCIPNKIFKGLMFRFTKTWLLSSRKGSTPSTGLCCIASQPLPWSWAAVPDTRPWTGVALFSDGQPCFSNLGQSMSSILPIEVIYIGRWVTFVNILLYFTPTLHLLYTRALELKSSSILIVF